MRLGTKYRIGTSGILAFLLGMMMAGTLVFADPDPPKGLTAAELVAAANAKITSVSPAQAKQSYDAKQLFIDVREADEYAAGHIPGAVNIPRGLLEFNIAKVMPNRETGFVVYCAAGGRSALSTEVLLKMGYVKAVNMSGGWMAWSGDGYPTER